MAVKAAAKRRYRPLPLVQRSYRYSAVLKRPPSPNVTNRSALAAAVRATATEGALHFTPTDAVPDRQHVSSDAQEDDHPA